MKLDRFDQKVLETKGNASDVMYELYEKRIGQNNAQKQLAGIRTHINYKAVLGKGRDIGEMEETITKADGSVTTKRMLLLSEEDSKDPTKVMALMGYDPLQWKVDWCKTRRSYWDVSMKLREVIGYDNNNKPIYNYYPKKKTNHAYMCELTVEPIQDILTVKMLQEIWDDVTFPVVEPYKYRNSQPCMLELPILDFQLGKRGGDMTLELETKLYKYTILDILSQLEQYRIRPEQIMYILGQDFYHVDGVNETTAKGTPMNTTAKWSDVYQTGIELLLWTVEQLRPIAPVELIYVPGNHDPTLSFCAANMLLHKYKTEPNVIVDAVDYPRKYRQYGINLIGHSHGRDEGKARIKTIMQEEASDLWGNTKIREFHLGDLHHEEVKEEGGITFRRMSALTTLDTWHIDKAYTAQRKAQAIVWNKEKGKQLTIDVNVTA